MVEEARFWDVTNQPVETQLKEFLVEGRKTRNVWQDKNNMQEPGDTGRADDENHEDWKKDGQREKYSSHDIYNDEERPNSTYGLD